jgi:hypothetical protein
MVNVLAFFAEPALMVRFPFCLSVAWHFLGYICCRVVSQVLVRVGVACVFREPMAAALKLLGGLRVFGITHVFRPVFGFD